PVCLAVVGKLKPPWPTSWEGVAVVGFEALFRWSFVLWFCCLS
ncbi:hypothetical protein A2U01_0075146, partial [Trifolium medium]|nr:hypothetical protein [Trifolium medium]